MPKGEANCCKDYTMFDMEYYRVPSEKDGEWFSDLSNFPDVTGIAYFLRDNLNDKDFNFEEFVKDAEDISWLRGLLYECYDNKPKASRKRKIFIIMCSALSWKRKLKLLLKSMDCLLMLTKKMRKNERY